MALPNTIISAASAGTTSPNPVHKASNGAFYRVVRTNGRFSLYKTSDPSAGSWTEVAFITSTSGATMPDSFGYSTPSALSPDGATIWASTLAYTDGGGYQPHVYRIDTATDTINEEGWGPYHSYSGPDGPGVNSICVGPTHILVIFSYYNGSNQTTLSYWVFAADGSSSNTGTLYSNNTQDVYSQSACWDSTEGVFHVAFLRESTNNQPWYPSTHIMTRSVTTAGTLSATNSFTYVNSATYPIHTSALYLASDPYNSNNPTVLTVAERSPNSDGNPHQIFAFGVDSANNLLNTLTQGSAGAATAAAWAGHYAESYLLQDAAGDVWLVYSAINGDIIIRKRTGLTSFGAATVAVDTAVDMELMSVNIYTRAGAEVMAFVYHDGTNLIYNEYSLTTTTQITATGIPSAESFGSSSVRNTQIVTAGSTTSAEAFGAGLLNTSYTITATGLQSTEAFGSSSVFVEQTVTTTGIPTAEGFGTAQLFVEQRLFLAGIEQTNAFGLPEFFLEQRLTAFGFEEATFGQTTLSQQPVLYASGIPSEEAFGDTEVTFPIQPAGLPSMAVVGSPALNFTLYADPAELGEHFESPVIQIDQDITVPTLGDTSALGEAYIAALAIKPEEWVPEESFGEPQLNFTLNTDGISSAEAVGNISVEALTSVAPTGIMSAESVTEPLVTIYVLAESGDFSHAPSSPAVFVQQRLYAIGTGTGEAFGEPQAILMLQLLEAEPILSQEAFGNPASTGALSPLGLASAAAFGQTSLLATYGMGGIGLQSEETFGEPKMWFTIRTTGIPSSSVVNGPAELQATVSPVGFQEEAFGFHIVRDVVVSEPILITGTIV